MNKYQLTFQEISLQVFFFKRDFSVRVFFLLQPAFVVFWKKSPLKGSKHRLEGWFFLRNNGLQGLFWRSRNDTTTHLARLETCKDDPAGPWALFSLKQTPGRSLTQQKFGSHTWGNRFTRIHTFSKQPEQPEEPRSHERSPPSYILHPQGLAAEVIQLPTVALVALVLMVPALVAPQAVRSDHNSLCSLANKARRVGTFQTSYVLLE